jgi:hypothetical protein
MRNVAEAVSILVPDFDVGGRLADKTSLLITNDDVKHLKASERFATW